MKPVRDQLAQSLIHNFVRRTSTFGRFVSDFHAEGAGIGDVDGDGKNDLTYGPFWFAGPDFGKQRRFAEGNEFPLFGYSDNFFSFVQDLTGDGRKDIVVFGFPGKEVRLFVNPGAAGFDERWPMHVIVDQLCHEATTLVDLIPGGLPEIVGALDKAYGYYAAGPDVTQPWKWHPISVAGRAQMPFGHGMGVGDLNGDGQLDIVSAKNVGWRFIFRHRVCSKAQRNNGG